MKRFALILALCLSVQMSAMAAPFVHVHGDAGHETDHHNGRTAHRHVASHGSTGHVHYDDPGIGHRAAAEDGSTHVTDAERDAHFLGGVTALRAATITLFARPAHKFMGISPKPAALLYERAGRPEPAPPDASPPPLRGPPR